MLDALPAGMELLVLDDDSTDATAALARSQGARVITRALRDFVEARRFALAQVRTPWTLMIDADELPDDRLRAAILAADEEAEGYVLSRDTYYCGRPLRLWRGEKLLRLFRTDRARLVAAPAAGGGANLHERWECDGRIAELPGTLLHESYPDAPSYLRKYARYTQIEASGMQPDAAAAVAEMLLAIPRFANLLLRRGALLDGPRGWIVAWYSALYPAVVRWKALRS